ncbi:Clp protease [Desertihabitans brevis]|uniref:Clp protease n=1 Tax=Desertihabitans brevis TaxID=2268447 RepID=A0A367YS51_9ACTN|nr:Clp protease N-terminal domain-containing protein [Desertihabitans brevis]RCK68716.1 Clp protease [Desertihabitans brevis]
MFEKFTAEARRTVVLAQEDARSRHQGQVRTENLLICLYDPPGAESVGAEVLTRAGLPRSEAAAAVQAIARTDPSGPDAQKLWRLGIDLDAVRSQAEEAFGPGALERTRAGRRRAREGHIPFDAAARTALELTLREALDLGHRHLGTEHLVLGLVRAEAGAAAHIMAAAGLTLDGLRAAVAELAPRR